MTINKIGDYSIKECGIKENYVASPGRCIYCDERDTPLSDEHVIGTGLCGNLVLVKATCKTCRDITSRAERIVMRGMFTHGRGSLGIGSNRRGKKTIATIYRDGLPEVGIPTDVEFSDKSPYFLPVFLADSLPAIVKGTFLGSFPPQRPLVHVVMPPDGRQLFNKLGAEHGAFSIRERVSLPALAQMIAKIAHSYAVSELGIDGFNPLLKSYIRQENPRPDIDTNLIGSYLSAPFLSLHDMSLGISNSGNALDKNYYHLVRLRLFSFLMTPVFVVAVGTQKASC